MLGEHQAAQTRQAENTRLVKKIRLRIPTSMVVVMVVVVVGGDGWRCVVVGGGERGGWVRW